jgi:hypothetical protein
MILNVSRKVRTDGNLSILLQDKKALGIPYDMTSVHMGRFKRPDDVRH